MRRNKAIEKLTRLRRDYGLAAKRGKTEKLKFGPGRTKKREAL
jgi:hypothetical protein